MRRFIINMCTLSLCMCILMDNNLHFEERINGKCREVKCGLREEVVIKGKEN